MSLSQINVNNNVVTGVDNEPTAGSENLVKSGGVASAFEKVDKKICGVYFSDNKYPTFSNDGTSVIITFNSNLLLVYDDKTYTSVTISGTSYTIPNAKKLVYNGTTVSIDNLNTAVDGVVLAVNSNGNISGGLLASAYAAYDLKNKFPSVFYSDGSYPSIEVSGTDIIVSFSTSSNILVRQANGNMLQIPHTAQSFTIGANQKLVYDSSIKVVSYSSDNAILLASNGGDGYITEGVLSHSLNALIGKKNLSYLFDIAGLLSIDGSYFDLNVNEIRSSGNYKRTDYIPVTANQIIYYKLYGVSQVGLVAFFNATKTFVSAQHSIYFYDAVEHSGKFVCPADGFIILSCYKTPPVEIFASTNTTNSIYGIMAKDARNAIFDLSQEQEWTFGIMNNNEVISPNNTRIVTKNIVYAEEKTRISVDSGYNWYLYTYDASGTRISTSSSWESKEYTLDKGTYYRINVRKADDSTIQLSDSSHLHLQEIAGFFEELYNSTKFCPNDDWKDNFVRGSLNVTNLTANGQNTDSRLSLNPATPLHLKAGSVMPFPQGHKLYPTWKVNNVITYALNWYTKPFVCPVDGDYIFVYANNPESDFTESTIAEIVADLQIYDAVKLTQNKTTFKVQSKCLNNTGLHDNIISVARNGYDIENLDTPPEQSIPSYIEAYKNGYRYMLTDVQFTSDHIPVALHDETINSVARNPDGTIISDTLYISQMTLDEVDEYDFGIKKGSKYAGMKIMRTEDFIKWCKIMNCIPILEVKTALPNRTSDENCLALIDIIKKYGMSRKVIFEADAGHTTAVTLHEAFPYAEIGRTCTKDTDFSTLLTQTLAIKGENKVFWYLYLANNMTGQISNTMISLASANDISIGCSEVRNLSEYLSFMTDNNNLVCEKVAIRNKPFSQYVMEQQL